MSHSTPFERATGGGSGGRRGGTPNLASYGDEPKYDLSTIVQMVGVRALTLWSWEQQLGVPAPIRIADEVGSPIRRYSERDLIASLWLRDQIVNGMTPAAAAARLLSAQQPPADDPAKPDDFDAGNPHGNPHGEPPPRGRVNTGPLPENSLAPRMTRPTLQQSDVQRPPSTTGKLPPYGTSGNLYRSQPSGPLGTSSSPRISGPFRTSGPRRTSGPPRTSGPLQSSSSQQPYAQPQPQPQPQPHDLSSGPPQSGRISGKLWSPQTSGAAWVNPAALPPHMVSGPLPPSMGASSTGYAGASARADAVHAEGGVPWIGPGTSMRGPELRGLLPQLIRAFANFDTLAANQTVSEALGAFPVEKVCISLLQPALAHASDMWAHHQMSISERKFAENYVRGVLFAIFHKTAEHFEAPMVIVGCGPREMTDVAALVLAVFWRRAGLRVVFLGQDVDAHGLVQEAQNRRPALVALAVTTTHRIRSLNRLGKEIMQIPAPRPIFAFSGPIFARNSELQRKVSGVYLGDDPSSATWHVTNLLGADRSA